MMQTVHLTQTIEDLESSQIEKQVSALESATIIVNSLATKAVEALEKSENRFLVAERLLSLGTVIVPYLEKLLKESDNEEAKILASLVLIKLNSKSGVPILLDAVANSEEYAGIAAEYLADVKAREAIDIIIERLSCCEFKQVDLMVSLIDALAKLDGKLPLEWYKCFVSTDVPWQIKTICEEKFSSDLETVHIN